MHFYLGCLCFYHFVTWFLISSQSERAVGTQSSELHIWMDEGTPSPPGSTAPCPLRRTPGAGSGQSPPWTDEERVPSTIPHPPFTHLHLSPWTAGEPGNPKAPISTAPAPEGDPTQVGSSWFWSSHLPPLLSSLKCTKGQRCLTQPSRAG